MSSSELSHTFEWPEYVVFSSILALSAGIGVFYGCFGSKQNSNEEFLMGNRQMAPFPVALSLLCSFISAITLLGTPAEIYFYGTQYFMLIFAFIPLTLSLTWLYVPVYFELQLTSAYEYLELRFNRQIRIAVSTVSILYLLIYMSIVVIGPSLALSYVTGINHRISVVSIFVVCIFYSTLGGFKSVVATDMIQCIIMILSMVVVVIKGVSDIGGIEYVLEKASNSSRIEFFNFDPDPRTRYTIWGSVVGEYFGWLSIYAATQTNVQRFVSIASIPKIRRALIYNMIGLIIVVGLSFSAGLVIYAKYSNCDPVSTKKLESSDQLLPLFVMDTLGTTPGLPGFFVAGVTCASLSTVSSGLNSLAAIISEDFIKHYRPSLSQLTMSNISKGICVICGIASFLFSFVAERADGIYPTALALMGSTLGPTLGVFSLGMFFPLANSKGALLGILTGTSLVTFVSLGSVFASDLPNQKLPLSTAGCLDYNYTETLIPEDQLHWKDNEYSFLTQIFSISFLWISLIGSGGTIIFGVLFSFCFTNEPNSVDRRCISPPLLSLWEKYFPEKLKHVLIATDITRVIESNRNTVKINNRSNGIN